MPARTWRYNVSREDVVGRPSPPAGTGPFAGGGELDEEFVSARATRIYWRRSPPCHDAPTPIDQGEPPAEIVPAPTTGEMTLLRLAAAGRTRRRTVHMARGGRPGPLTVDGALRYAARKWFVTRL